MSKLFIFIGITLMVGKVYTAVGIQEPVEKPDEFACQEGCYNPDLNMMLPYNVTYSPQDGKSCKGYLCNIDGDTQIFTCGAIGVGTGCRLVPGDLTKPYPDCCDTTTCNPEASADPTATTTA